MTEKELEQRTDKRIEQLEQNGFYQEWRGMWVHEPSNKGYFCTGEIIDLSDHDFEKLLECKCIYSE